ncbi:hypothetical protein [Flavobacterium filum]|uniref:hypothetical protein n=1 Tax=Flavobacterium filum TaxID=370974 RepID=UPI0023F5183E|nr:hypothetical protein [Flavobacterium filum]
MYKLTQEGIEHFEKFFSLSFKPLPKVKHKKVKGKKLIIADVHAPAHLDWALKKAVNENLDCEDVIIVGDLWDFYSKSFYRKRQDIPFRDEFRQGYYILQWLSANFDKVYLQLANHDARFKKFLWDNVTPELLNYCHSNILEEFIGFIPNVEIIKQKIEGNREIEYIYQMENLILSHTEVSGTDVTKAVQEITKRLFKWQKTYRLKPYDAIIQAHNHSSGKIKMGDLFLFQIPCLIDIGNEAFSYVFDGKLKGSPPAIGYMIGFFGENGFDPRKSYIVDL